MYTFISRAIFALFGIIWFFCLQVFSIYKCFLFTSIRIYTQVLEYTHTQMYSTMVTRSLLEAMFIPTNY